MKVVILAAGKGTRLGQEDLPKPLTQLEAGMSILEWQLQALQRFIPLDKVIVVVGYHWEEILQRFPHLTYVYNPDFAIENTSKSLLRALETFDDDVLWMNGDVVFHPSILQHFFDQPRTSMLVNVGEVGEEEVKYRQNKKGLILEVSKKVSEPLGEALGINYCTKKDLKHLKANLKKCEPDDYFERAIELCIEEGGIQVWSVPIDRELCTEIDFHEDLQHANELIRSWVK